MNCLETNPFWDFSLRVYRAAGVASECLRLQDQLGADVNILLFCGWIGWEKNFELQLDDLNRVSSEVSEWNRCVLLPIRLARRYLKGAAPGPLYERIKLLELGAERHEQDRLYFLAADCLPANGGADRADALRRNIDLCLNKLYDMSPATSPLSELIIDAIGDSGASGL